MPKINWAALRQSGGSYAKGDVTPLVRAVYRAAGLSPPAIVLETGSPLAMERHRKSQWFTLNPGRPVRSPILRNLFKAIVQRFIAEQGPTSMMALDPPVVLMPSEVAVETVLVQRASHILWTIGDYARGVRSWASGRGPSVYLPYETCCIPQGELCHAAEALEYLRDDLEFRPAREGTPLVNLASQVSWLLPHETACWFCRGPSSRVLDERGRLHNPSGPAITFEDGLSIYAWKGVIVPEWAIRDPEMITARFIERQPNPQLARALIDIMTPEVFIRKADGLERTQDDWGVLWRKRMSETMSWSAVEVVNGSPEADGRHKLYFLQVPPELESPLEAVAWTYGMTGEQYKSLAART